jgi:hypothetical protein
MEVRSAAMHAATKTATWTASCQLSAQFRTRPLHHLGSVTCARPCRREARGLVYLAVVRISICLSQPTMLTYAKVIPYGSCTAISRFSNASAIGVSVQGFEER